MSITVGGFPATQNHDCAVRDCRGASFPLAICGCLNKLQDQFGCSFPTPNWMLRNGAGTSSSSYSGRSAAGSGALGGPRSGGLGAGGLGSSRSSGYGRANGGGSYGGSSYGGSKFGGGAGGDISQEPKEVLDPSRSPLSMGPNRDEDRCFPFPAT